MPINVEDFPAAMVHLKNLFATGIHTVVFTKSNGDTRVLKGSRDPNVIGLEEFEAYVNPPPKKDGSPRMVSNTSLAVFDVEAKGWRSFKLSSLISINNTDINTFLNTTTKGESA